MERITVRPFAQDDWPALERIHDRARRKELEWAGLSKAFVPFSQASAREGLFDYTVCVAVFEGAVRGFAAFSEDELAWLYVDPDYGRRGIGKRLIAYVQEHTRRPLSIEVLAGNEPALGLYRSMGFSVLKTSSGKMPGNESFEVTAILLEKRQ